MWHKNQNLVPAPHLQDLHHNLLVVGDVDGLEHLAVLPSAQLTDQLVVLLVAIGTGGEAERSRCDRKGGEIIFSVTVRLRWC